MMRIANIRLNGVGQPPHDTKHGGPAPHTPRDISSQKKHETRFGREVK